jgi:hypothetical protein
VGGSGTFSILNPSLRFDVGNNIGIPLNTRIPSLAGMNADLTGFIACTGIPDPVPVSSPGAGQEGQTLNAQFTLDNTNSNLAALIQSQPELLVSQAQITTNPSGRSLNYIPGNGKMTVDVTLSLPLYGRAKDFAIRDTLPFSYTPPSELESLAIRIGVENWFPMEATAFLIFTDENQLPVDTILVPGSLVIPSGTIMSPSERVSLPGTRITEIPLTASEIEKIAHAKYLIVEARASTAGGGNTDVKIFSDYRIKVSIGARAKISIQ